MDEQVFSALADMHVHFRDGHMLDEVAGETDRVCQACLAMPNLTPPISTPERVKWYSDLLRDSMPNCRALVAAKLMPNMQPADIQALHAAGAVAMKLYPEGVTTNSQDGIGREFLRGYKPDADLPNIWGCFHQMAELGMVLCLHGEMPGEETLHREEQFLPFFDKVVNGFPTLKIVLEHITTKEAVEYVKSNAAARRKEGFAPVAATITLHHLLITLDDVIGDKLKPHNFCKPIAKEWVDRRALQVAALSGDPCFFLGSDSAPHPVEKKECAECCAGCYTAPALAEQLYEFFDQSMALHKFDGFCSQFGLGFYGLKDSGRKIRFVPSEWTVSAGGIARPWAAGTKLSVVAQEV